MAKKPKRKLVKGVDYDGWREVWVDEKGKEHKGEFVKNRPCGLPWRNFVKVKLVEVK